MNNLRIWMEKNLKGDPIIWFIVISFSVVSILVVYSASGALAYRRMEGNTEYFLIKQAMLIGFGLLAMWLAHKIDYRYYFGLSRIALWVSVPLLLFTWLFGSDINHASRWLTIPIINQTFQPSDFAKLALLASLAGMLSKRQQNIDNLKESLLPIIFWTALICGLIALSNISTACVLFLSCILMLFIGRVPLKQIGMLFLGVLIAGGLALAVGQRLPTAVSRIHDYIETEKVSYQSEQSYIAIATGGVLGKGPGNSEQRNFLPQPYSDFIYAIIVEEYGLIGGVTIIFMYLLLLFRGVVTVAQSSRAFGGLLAAGLCFALVIQAFVNVFVVIGLMPVTGLPLPMLSMGGTSILFTGAALGIIQSVAHFQKEESRVVAEPMASNS